MTKKFVYCKNTVKNSIPNIFIEFEKEKVKYLKSNVFRRVKVVEIFPVNQNLTNPTIGIQQGTKHDV